MGFNQSLNAPARVQHLHFHSHLIGPTNKGPGSVSYHTPGRQKLEILLNDNHTCLSLLFQPVGILMLTSCSCRKDKSHTGLKWPACVPGTW